MRHGGSRDARARRQAWRQQIGLDLAGPVYSQQGPIRQAHRPSLLNWVRQALEVLGRCFGGATAFPQGQGVWRDDAQGGKLLYDEPVVIQCYTSDEALEQHAVAFRDFLGRMGTEARQGAVGFVIDRDYLEIRFPLSRRTKKSRKGADRDG
jgi:hypothetical protein